MKISIMRWHHKNIEERLWIMKELEIVIKPEKLENLKRILDSEGARGVMIQQYLAMVTRRELVRYIQEMKLRVSIFCLN